MSQRLFGITLHVESEFSFGNIDPPTILCIEPFQEEESQDSKETQNALRISVFRGNKLPVTIESIYVETEHLARDENFN